MKGLIVSLAVCSAVMSAVSCLYILLSRWLKSVWSAKRRYYLWLPILIGFLTPIKPDFGLSPIEIKVSDTPVANLSVLDTPDRISGFSVLFLIWLSGTAATLIYYALKQKDFRRGVERLSKPCEDCIDTMVGFIASQMGIKNARAVMLKEAATPMVIGFKAPTIILPESTYSTAELRLIIKHELTHFKRHDLAYKCLILFCRAVHWFNPFMRLFSRCVDRECELSCDECVIKSESYYGKKMYCESILSTVLAKKPDGSLTPVLSGNFEGSKKDLRHRLEMIISPKGKRKLSAICIAVVLITILSGNIFAVESTGQFSDKILSVTTAPLITDAQGNTANTSFDYLPSSVYNEPVKTTTSLTQPAVFYDETEPLPANQSTTFKSTTALTEDEAYEIHSSTTVRAEDLDEH